MRQSDVPVLLSIVVPLHDSRAFASSFAQYVAAGSDRCDTRSFEIILVDDGSADGSLNEFLTLLPSGIRVKSHSLQGTQGPGTARNSGLRLAEGQFVAFWDADDRAALLPYMDLARRLSEGDLLLGALGYVMQGPELGDLEKCIPQSESDLFRLLFQRPAIWRFVFRREGLVNLGIQFPSLLYGEDLLFMLDVAGRGEQQVATHSTLGYWHQLGRSGSLSTKPASRDVIRLLQELSRVLDDSTSPQLRALTLQWLWRVWARGSLIAKFVTSPSLLSQTTKAVVRGYLYPSARWAWASMAERGGRDQSTTETTNEEWPQANV